jgi:hypothetical protein
MGIFSQQPSYTPPVQTVQAPPPPPTPVDASVVNAANQTKARLAASGGASGTMLTGGQGVAAPAMVNNKTLLGA